VSDLVRMVITCALAAIAVTGFSSPAHAAATNPFTLAQACANDFGGQWAHANDGERPIKDKAGKVVGHVYLMYNGQTGENCVATIKRVNLGQPTRDNAVLEVPGGERVSGYREEGYKYYTAVKGDARDKCVKYWGSISIEEDGDVFQAGRFTWGNCG
jgi:hypothetical protein